MRVAEHDGSIYLDLADEFWRCIEIDAAGWRIVQDPRVRFRRPAGMLPLPIPVRGGFIEHLAQLGAIAESARSRQLRVSGRLVTRRLRSAGPFPLLAVSGKQGSAKTMFCKLLRALIDPNAAPVRALSRRKFAICALDNS